MGSEGPSGFLAGALEMTEAEKRASLSRGCFVQLLRNPLLALLLFISQWRDPEGLPLRILQMRV